MRMKKSDSNDGTYEQLKVEPSSMFQNKLVLNKNDEKTINAWPSV